MPTEWIIMYYSDAMQVICYINTLLHFRGQFTSKTITTTPINYLHYSLAMLFPFH